MNPTLNAPDSFALRCVLSKTPLPEALPISPFMRGLLDALRPYENEQGYQFLRHAVISDDDLVREVIRHDPTAPFGQDDPAYVEDYIRRATSEANAPAPDLTRTNGSSALLTRLYHANQLYGPQAARQMWEAHNGQPPAEEAWPVFTPAQYVEQAPVEFYDADRIIQKGEVTAIVGQPGCGKSFWTLMKMAELADSIPVLYLAAEGLNPDRLLAVEKARGKKLSEQLFIINRTVDLTSEAVVESFVQHIAALKPQVVAIDTFAACTPGIDENASKDMQPILNRIRERIIQPLGCAVILIHHTTKDGKTFRGSSALRGNVANMYYLAQDDEVITLKADKQRDSELAPERRYQLVSFPTRLHPQTGEPISSVAMLPYTKVVHDPRQDLTRNQRLILETLEPFANGLTTRGIEDATGMAKATLWRNIQKLAKAGMLRTGEKGEPVYITEDGRRALLGGE